MGDHEIDDSVRLNGDAPGGGLAGMSEKPTRFVGDPLPGPATPLPKGFGESVRELEVALAMPVWLLIQTDGRRSMTDSVYRAFFEARQRIPEGKPVALLIDSPGGLAKVAYQIAKLFRSRSSGFAAIVPRYAKSAATLLALGADVIIMSPHAELGPLDAQFIDRDREQYGSALDEVQALERLNAASLEAIDQTMMLLVGRTGKKMDVVLPVTLKFVSDMMRPLLEKIDTVQYSQRSRMLKVAEEYAIRLLTPKLSQSAAEEIARKLVENYPAHDFVIDPEEARALGLRVEGPSADVGLILEKILPFMDKLTVVGQVRENPET